MKISFLGAAKLVTGSCYLFESDGKKILIDCGMYQGLDDDGKNLEFNFNPETIDSVLLTHAHIDHSGLIPKLYKEGFKGKVYATYPTVDLIELLLLDSAKIQENNNFDKYGRHYEKKVTTAMLYDTNDVYLALDKVETVRFDEWMDISNVKVKFISAGHILGAASIIIECEGKKIIFSGDIGRQDQSIINPYKLIDEEVDYVVMESLYGGLLHEEKQISRNKLYSVIQDTQNVYGNVMVPVFAVHRAQEMILELKQGLLENRIKDDVQIFFDGPLMIEVTKLYTKYLFSSDINVCANESTKKLGENVFYLDNLKYVFNNKESLKLMRSGNRIVLAGGGMCEGGRIMNHLPRGLKNKKSKIVFVGYQAEGTLGREIVSGTKKVKINNKNIDIKADVVDLKGFSAHADNGDLLNWVDNKKTNRLKQVFLTHAQIERSENFREQLVDRGYSVYIPDLNSSVTL